MGHLNSTEQGSERTLGTKLLIQAKFKFKMDSVNDYNRFTPDPDNVFQESIENFEDIQ